MAEGWEGFWDRFRFADEVPVLYGDSNLHAGLLTPSTFGFGQESWDTVSLWDAHHDCGYKGTGSYEAWLEKGVPTCEDWMLRHYQRGSRLEVIYPSWRREVGQVESEPLVPVDRRVDDGTDPDREYHAVYVCRSGAWVPPWCDDQFTQFIEQGPNPFPMEVPGNEWVHPRGDVRAAAEAHAERLRQLEEVMREQLMKERGVS